MRRANFTQRKGAPVPEWMQRANWRRLESTDVLHIVRDYPNENPTLCGKQATRIVGPTFDEFDYRICGECAKAAQGK